MSTSTTGIAHRGRQSLKNQADAISRTRLLYPQRDAILAALDQVTGSTAFHNSKRAAEFLRYVVERSLAGEVDYLKERSIGSSLFGRTADYDTGGDAVVRVTASDVRRRLQQYYEQQGTTDPVIFDLPLGSYVPEIRIPAPDEPATPDPVASDAPGPALSLLRRGGLGRWRWLAISVVLLVAIGAVAAARPWRTGPREARLLPWAALFQGSQATQMVMADSGFGALMSFGGAMIPLDDYANRRFQQAPDAMQSELRGLWGSLARSQLTSVADARVIGRFSALAATAQHGAAVRFAREVQLQEFHQGSNLILLGSAVANPWVELFQDVADFQIRYDTVQRRQHIFIRSPLPGESEELGRSVFSGMSGRAWAILGLYNGLDGKGVVAIAAGTNMEGTQAAGDLLFDTDRLAGVLKGCGVDPADASARFEILLRLDVLGNSARASEVIARRCHPGR